MYARDLMIWLHERLAERGTFDQTLQRFERLRGNDLLPRGRENASKRLSNEHVASAVLGFAHPSPGFAGHASLVLGELRPVGGQEASFKSAATLKSAIADLVGQGDNNSDLVRLNLFVEQDFNGDEYSSSLYFKENGKEKKVSFVSKYAHSLLEYGAQDGYNHERLNKLTAIGRSLSSKFFRSLARELSISRHLDRPLKTDWREYETEEQKAEFHRKLGARRSSDFLNLRVDAQVTWPKEPTRIKFGAIT